MAQRKTGKRKNAEPAIVLPHTLLVEVCKFAFSPDPKTEGVVKRVETALSLYSFDIQEQLDACLELARAFNIPDPDEEEIDAETSMYTGGFPLLTCVHYVRQQMHDRGVAKLIIHKIIQLSADVTKAEDWTMILKEFRHWRLLAMRLLALLAAYMFGRSKTIHVRDGVRKVVKPTKAKRYYEDVSIHLGRLNDMKKKRLLHVIRTCGFLWVFPTYWYVDVVGSGDYERAHELCFYDSDEKAADLAEALDEERSSGAGSASV